jgi:hypothetical protein
MTKAQLESRRKTVKIIGVAVAATAVGYGLYAGKSWGGKFGIGIGLAIFGTMFLTGPISMIMLPSMEEQEKIKK